MPAPLFRRRMKLILPAVMVLALTATGCSEIIPDFNLRDSYFGKSILQPSKTAKPVKRDREGNPVIKE